MIGSTLSREGEGGTERAHGIGTSEPVPPGRLGHPTPRHRPSPANLPFHGPTDRIDPPVPQGRYRPFSRKASAVTTIHSGSSSWLGLMEHATRYSALVTPISLHELARHARPAVPLSHPDDVA